MSPRSNTESYPAFAHIGLRENPGKNLNQSIKYANLKQTRCPHLFIFLEGTVLPSARISRPSACLHTHVKRNSNATIGFRLHAYAIGVLNCVDAAIVPLHTTARMRLSSYKKCFRVARIVSNSRNKTQLTLVLLPQISDRHVPCSATSYDIAALLFARQSLHTEHSVERRFN
ncbi:hypothetical protein ANN_16298 [Periplaneta americana]|uniref:Uncharacterized protein n=1 Tax=Periplaneta americana TaxID=6978 RepID=A0ABQ8SIK9_PERAM|nr:hypothetical protein ANN_16298 [Periplaneta americana]